MIPRWLLFATLALSGSLSGQLALSVTQPMGPGSLEIAVTGADPADILFNLFSLVPHSPTGAGPIFGLGLPGSDVVLTQLLQPLGSAPFHVLPTPTGTYTWGFALPPGGGPCLSVDAVSVSYSPVTGVSDVSPVVSACLAF